MDNQPIQDRGQVSAIIVAGGSGTRFGNQGKTFIDLCGRPLVAWSLDALERAATVDEIVLVAGAHTLEAARSLHETGTWRKLREPVVGGARRQDSVACGFAAISTLTAIVMIHDGARPLITSNLVDATTRAAFAHDAVITAVPVTDTLKRVDSGGQILRTVPREGMRSAQTPQAFRRQLLQQALQFSANNGSNFTDEAGIVEAMDIPVFAIPGSPTNIKVTNPEDLLLAEFQLQRRMSPLS